MANYLIVGGAGFIGVNAAKHYAESGHAVTILDNLSRQGTSDNLKWILTEHPDIRFVRAEIRSDQAVLETEAARCDVLLHLAAQVAVTASVADPRTDFAINALGTLNVLEAVRRASRPPILLFASTNKVYGAMEEVPVIRDGDRYRYQNLPSGVSEEHSLDFHSPYGCSKGAADQYVRDYARIYGLRTVVFRQSCIYGQRQFGVEDQGWVAWFSIAALLERPITIYGDGLQIRDLLHVNDLVAAYKAAAEKPDRAAGQIFNMGGGPSRTLSLVELLAFLEKRLEKKIPVGHAEPRAGDQPVFVADIRKAERELGWRPEIDPLPGIGMLIDWIQQNRADVERVVATF